MIRKSLLIGAFALFACLAFLGRAHAADRENASSFWSEQYAHGALIEPHPAEAISDAMRGTSRFLTHHMNRLIGRVSHGYRSLSRFTRSSGNVTSAAARYIGTNPTGWAHNWCAEFANRVLRHQGYQTSGSAMAISFAHYGPHVAPRPGAIAVLRGHVGFVESVQGDSIVLVSGNGGRRHGARGRVTTRNVYPRRLFVAFVMPRRSRSL